MYLVFLNKFYLKKKSFFFVFLGLFFVFDAFAFASYLDSDSKCRSITIDYKETKSDLCLFGELFDTDKTPWRNNPSPTRHAHPYTLFYDAILKGKKDNELTIAELGILEGASLLMWGEYFSNARIYGFDNNEKLIERLQSHPAYDPIKFSLFKIDVCDAQSIRDVFSVTNEMYDLIIDDTTHQFDDQIRVVYNVLPFLKAGGLLIIEDIFKETPEQDYLKALEPILSQFQDYYFVTLDHNRRCSTGWDNDKLLVLVKGGAEPIFKNKTKLTIITPSIRVNNLQQLKDSIDFSYVEEWIIVYDGRVIEKNPNLFHGQEGGKIKEYVYRGDGISGNPQRNFALDHFSNPDTYLYFLDDDNKIHPHFYRLVDLLSPEHIYTFGMFDPSMSKVRFRGNQVVWGGIDTAMFLVYGKIGKKIRWRPGEYTADFYFIHDCLNSAQKSWIFVDTPLCTYNFLNR